MLIINSLLFFGKTPGERIPSKISTIEELNLPQVLYDFTKASQGFVLITGPSSQSHFAPSVHHGSGANARKLGNLLS